MITATDIAIKLYHRLIKLDLFGFPEKPVVELHCPKSVGIGTLRFSFKHNNEEKKIEFGILVDNILQIRLAAEQAVDNYDTIISTWLNN